MFQKILLFFFALVIAEMLGVNISLPLVIFLVLLYAAYYFAWRHFRELTFDKLAKKLSFSRIEESTVGPIITSAKLSLFRNSDCKASRAIGGEQNKITAILADLVISTDTGIKGGDRYGRHRNSPINITSVASCCIIIDPKMNLPVSSLYDETIWEKVVAAIGGQDIDFDDDPAFSSRFTLQGPSEVNVRDFYNKKLRNKLLQIIPGKFALETSEDRIIVYTKGHASARELEALADTALGAYKIYKETALECFTC
ncbi:MAG: hypothetical protein PHF29_04010 [Candidatus Riflebacteria bacterium]|nr:hypothetical protein [Candidatus Riflebacteria bacterium]